jgi:hypothetical protein
MTSVDAETMLYRSMKATSSGVPECGPTARTLGARIPRDIEPDQGCRVHFGTGGMSVSPDDPMYLPPHRRPPPLCGYGKDLVFGIAASRLGADLGFRRDPQDLQHHGFVEPAFVVLVDAYQRSLCATAEEWRPWRPA